MTTVPNEIELHNHKQNKMAAGADCLDVAAISAVMSSWEHLKAIPDIKPIVGELIFGKFFELAPHAKRVFPFEGATLEDIFADPAFQAHSGRVVETFDYVVSSLMELERHILVELGERHALYPGVSPDFFAPLGSAILHALETGLSDIWTPELKEHWLQIITFLATSMSEGMIKKKQALQKGKKKKLNLTVKEVHAIMSCWEALKLQDYMSKFWSSFFTQFFTLIPNGNRKIFYGQWSSRDWSASGRSLGQHLDAHALRVTEMFDLLIGGLLDFDREIVVDLGRRHGSFQFVKREHLPIFMESLHRALETTLEEVSDENRQVAWDEEADLAWGNLFKLISDAMAEGMSQQEVHGS
uniref:Globin domain-containing protein n=1 Tax=Entomoneis paludosa TaxID=265537 RepID=A0A7S2Y3F8_9STRA|mmetsp:Transcript_1260/g.2769  ORF Transcript_1260/g.2769 Transcript_1260/m.2769 type:complete len:355 (+) Transcript_1260:168-1232(+)|eukprot:CAMPEP_0172463924 /NCGR_PEP_ID=MMETSP1065-20121228/48828_1 /TAXON_ID=265537 /ORGANISM="Amphiprora paludosa, Strain CCMP125" /LENGTH=354 /DNA_ID=CAMNT_0013220005 /DNA_START=162 /DNA_END=1226 /DNA_ORIENTATION=-